MTSYIVASSKRDAASSRLHLKLNFRTMVLQAQVNMNDLVSGQAHCKHSTRLKERAKNIVLQTFYTQ